MNIVNKVRNMPSGIKASGGLFVASIVTKGIAYITTPVYTRLLSTDEFGQVSVFFTWQNVFGIIAMFCLMNGVFNNGMVDYPNERDNYSFSMLILSNLITTIFAVITICLFPFIQQHLNIQRYQLILMLVTFWFQPAYNFWTAKQRYEFKYKASVFWSILIAILSPICGIIAIIIFDNQKVAARLIAGQGIMVVIYALFYIYLAYKNNFHADKRFWKTAIIFNLPLIPHYLSALLLSSSDRIMISIMVNDSAAAFYSLAVSVATVVLIVWEAINASLIPYTYEHCKTRDYESISRITSILLTIFAVVCTLLILVAPELVKIMATNDYNEAIYIIPPLVGGVFFQVLYYLAANIIYYYKKPKYVMFASILATFLNLILNYCFIQWFGYAAAAYTTIICYAIQAIIDFVALRKIVGVTVYNMKFILSLSLIMMVFSIFSKWLYDFTIMRYLIFTSLLLIIFLSRKQIIEVMLKVRTDR